MRKIKTLFIRDFNNNGRITRKYAFKPDERWTATEKMDGTNVRLTVRNHQMARLEKRRNPTKLEKAKGMIDPWYVDADEFGPEDKHIWEATRNTDLTDIPDGEWSGEAIGPKIQGNCLKLEKKVVFLFSALHRKTYLVFEGVPLTYDGLKKWLPKQKSKIGIDCGIEGIVWWFDEKPVAKIKLKDFK